MPRKPKHPPKDTTIVLPTPVKVRGLVLKNGRHEVSFIRRGGQTLLLSRDGLLEFENDDEAMDHLHYLTAACGYHLPRPRRRKK